METKTLTQREIEIGLMLTCSMRNYSAKMAQADLFRLTDGNYYLDGYTGCYEIKHTSGAIICSIGGSMRSLRPLVIAALNLWLPI